MGAAAVVGGISAVVAVAGLAMTAEGQHQAGKAASANANYQAQVAANNATIANQNADYAMAAGQEQATQVGLKGAAVGGRLRAAIAANNVDVNTGSAVDVQETQRESGQLDKEQTINNSLLRAYGYRVAGTGDTAQSGLLSAEAGQAGPAADIGAAGSLLSGASAIPFKFGGLSGSGVDQSGANAAYASAYPGFDFTQAG